MVIFDCDGVLVGGENLSTALMGEEARKYGWNITNAEANKLFSGGELAKIGEKIAAHTGRKLPGNWAAMMEGRIVSLMRKEAKTVDGAEEMLRDVIDLGLPIRVGSNSSEAEMEAKFARTGLDEILEEERIHSGRDLNMPKPRPDIYLYAAAEEGIPPANCLVLEDSDAGVEAARKAGMACVLLRPFDKPAPQWPGLLRISHLDQFVPLLRKVLASQSQA
ncbi:HAD family hydrolase [Oecophyllibacter saccharovorans]|uniref:HAD family hydrolase n=1 Tax=Oecophyllibacter saccharovorans TaxID=2558360 RepID=UPI0011413863|nr:HAD family phosphatase [Oecophyllibacter saccharovorans]QDH15970.1 HAD family phosphatase [Oecophyllibacter saccharovorans]TPW35404.1 HAD family phosphatase [Oecophyllibacter saccharovorans]